MTTKTMMQRAWDKWHADMDPDDIPDINPSFRKGWESCAAWHEMIDLDKIHRDLVDYRGQVTALAAERDELRLQTDVQAGSIAAVQAANQRLASERVALREAAKLAQAFVEHVWRDVSLNEYSDGLRLKVEVELAAVLKCK